MNGLEGLTWQGWITIAIVLAALVFLAIPGAAPDLILLGAVTALLCTGVLSPGQALDGLSNEAMVTVAVLYVVGAGVRETGAIDWIASHVLGRPRTERAAVARLTLPVTIMSAFVNNTPLVAMMLPVIDEWCKKQRVASSKLMIPLSYAAILGGTCTLIGTSTNLVVEGLLKKHNGVELGMFEITWVGLPAALVGCTFLIFTSPWLLPDRRPVISQLDDPREYTVEMLVPIDSALVGRTIEQAGLRHLPDVYLIEIDREGNVLAAVSPEERLRAGDRLVFVGIVESVVDLLKIRGLTLATDQVFKLDGPRTSRTLVEAVVSNTCPLVGKTIREGRFRSRYHAAVLAVARNGERLRQKIGDIVLRPGDTLLMEGAASFAEEQRNRRDFFLVSRVENAHPARHDRAPIALAILTAMVASVALGYLTMLKAGLLAAGLMLATRCSSIASARRSIDLETLLAIAASFALGKALESTGAAATIANSMTGLAAGNAWGTLALVYLVTLVVTELITNNAAAALMFPFAMATAAELNVAYMPFVVAVMMAASAGFATPIGYQTNLMVYGPGGYRFSDYLKIGVPLDILIGVVTVIVAPLVWPF
ncbi:MAG TPA: SLC13 family permease [Pirellulales bacterium]|jgi:di/tricarboxylate transporter|nr:SLC13 family permease [Pirellulales bacterium]